MFITVSKTATRVTINGKNEHHEGPPKTFKSNRKVPIKSTLVDRITKHLFIEKQKHVTLGINFSKDSHFFTNSRCNPLRGDRINSAWKKRQLELDIAPLNFHCLRHTCATLLAQQGIRLEVAAEILGHDSIETTAAIYVHVNDEDKKEAINAINSLPSGDQVAIEDNKKA